MRFTSVLTAWVALSLTLPTWSQAQVATRGVEPVAFTWDELKTFVQGCAIQPTTRKANGRVELLPIVSICPHALTIHGSTARFRLKKVPYSAVLLESPYADDGDLNTLVIRDAQGNIVAQADHLPAFGDILLALAGGDDSFRQVSVDPTTLEE